MFCRNCGEQYVTDEAVMCVKCGAQKGTGNQFCPNCGVTTAPDAMACTNCGVSLAQTPVATGEPKDKMVAGLLGIFLGTFGVHNFYLGYKRNALIQCIGSVIGIVLACLVVPIFITCGMGIWGLIEGIFILTGKIDKDANGVPLK